MRNEKVRTADDFGQLRRKILLQSTLLFFAAVAAVFAFYRLFFFQNFGNFTVKTLNIILHDYAQAFSLYQRYVRNYLDFYFLTATGIVFLIVVRFYLKNFVRYFNEINDGINSILFSKDPLTLSPELSATERKINHIKRELEQKERTSREAEQRKNDLVMYLAHDIRTPLTSVIGYLNLLEEAPEMLTEQRANYTHIALDKAYRLERMVNEFFEITRFNARQTELHKESVDLSYMLMQLTDELTPVLDANGNTVRVDAADDLTVYGDPDKLARVFNNVLKNAAAYSTPNTEIRISAKEIDAGIRITFQNAGKTIPPDKLASLFERFYRVDEARASQTGGTGLGLAIAKEIVLLHGGTIAAASARDTVTITITLPSPNKENISGV